MEQLESTQPNRALYLAWKKGEHCPELDGVRGLAILMVSVYRFSREWNPEWHPLLASAKQFLAFGERGVELFFVLSGFLITGILLRTREKPKFFINFIGRRALRIFPLYYLALFLLLIVVPYWIVTPKIELALKQPWFLWTYTSNLAMSWQNQWCFGWMDHFWSLAVEEHFYLFWPIIVYLLAPKHLLRFCVVGIVVVSGSRVLAAHHPGMDVAVDVCTLFRADALLMGATLACFVFLDKHVPKIGRWASYSLPILFVLCLVAALRGGRYGTAFLTVTPLMWTLFLCMLVTTDWPHIALGWIRQRGLQWLGKYSYSMYVFQLPLVSLCTMGWFIQATQLEGVHPILQSLAYLTAMMVTIMGIAWLSFHLWEKHFLKLKRWLD